MPPADTGSTAVEPAEGSGDDAPDRALREVVEALTAELGDALVGTELRPDDAWLRVRPDAWRRAAEVCRAQGFDYFCFLSGIDWMPATAPNPEAAGAEMGDVGGEDGEAEAPAEASGDGEGEAAESEAAEGWRTGYAGGDTRFQVFARLYSISRKLGITLKADLDEQDPRVETWTGLYRGADWHERETWEMYGFTFEGHPHLAHLYLPGEFEGFPLRKDFPLLSREVKPWPGLVDVEPMPEEEEGAAATEEGG